VNEIKQSRRISAQEWADRILAELANDFDPSFEAIKTQRLLTASRDRDYVAEVCKHVSEGAASLPCSGKRRSVLKRHCEASLFFQEIFSALEKEGRALSVWKANFRDLASEAVKVLEDIFFHNVFAARSPFEKDASFSRFFQAGEAETRLIRDYTDWTIMILNEARSLANQSGACNFPREEMYKAFEFAKLVERAELIWSLYSFSAIEAYVKDNDMTFDELPRSREHQRMINYARTFNTGQC